MTGTKFSRRNVLKGSTALAATLFAAPSRAQAPPPQENISQGAKVWIELPPARCRALLG